MHIEEFRADTALAEEIAGNLATTASRYRSYLTISCHGRTVHALVLPACWEVLKIRAGDLVVAAAGARHGPPGSEDRAALKDFVESFRQS